MIDKLPAWLRHLLIVGGGTFAATLIQAVLAVRGVTGVDWPTVLTDAVNLTVVAVVTAAAALWGLPVTRQYGLFQDGRHEATGGRTEGVDAGTGA